MHHGTVHLVTACAHTPMPTHVHAHAHARAHAHAHAHTHSHARARVLCRLVSNALHELHELQPLLEEPRLLALLRSGRRPAAVYICMPM